MVYYKLVKITTDAPGLAKVIIDVVIRHHGLSNSIITNRGPFFTSKFWLLLCYFLGIKRKLSTTFHLQMNGQIERQNSIIEAYFRVFINFKQNNWAWLLFMTEFAYNNAKNTSTSRTLFELNCGYHPCIFYKEDLDLCSKSKNVEELFFELQKFIAVCQQNLYRAQEFQKRAHNKKVKPQSYTLGNKVWLSSKHLRIKRNCKLEVKFLNLFQVLHPVGKQTYKLKLLKK